MEELTSAWLAGADLELLRELLDGGVSPFLVPSSSEANSPSDHRPYSSSTDNINNNNSSLASSSSSSALYPGPTIRDIENALSVTQSKSQFTELINPPQQPRFLPRLHLQFYLFFFFVYTLISHIMCQRFKPGLINLKESFFLLLLLNL